MASKAKPGMFGLENIMRSFYDYHPKENDVYGNMMKNTFASNMIQSAFDTQNAKDLAYAQAEISSGMMNQAAELQRLNTKDIMRKEYQYGSDMLKQQFNYQQEFADDTYSRDLGMLSASGKEQRASTKQQQDSTERIETGRFNTQKEIADKQLEGTKYSSDSNLAGVKDTNQSQLEGTKYSSDTQLEGTKYSSDAQLEGTKYSSDAQLEGTKYSADAQLAGIKDTNRTSTTNIKVTGDETRKTQDNEQRLRALNRSQEHRMARGTARAY